MMEAADYGKLVYQSEFGPEHMAGEPAEVLRFLQNEMLELPAGQEPQPPEAIGGGMCRFFLSACTSDAACRLLAELFIRTAKECKGTKEGLLEKYHQLEKFEIAGIREWGRRWMAADCPPVRHSEAYRRAYRPHYRLLNKAYAAYFPVLLRVRELLEQKKQIFVSIDGRCGSGKTHLAALMEAIFGCRCIHVDDFYLSARDRKENWKEIPGGNIDFARLRKEILPGHPLTVIEGSYSGHPLLAVEYDIKIFLTCPKKEQARRLRVREKEYFPAFEAQWIPMEENYFSHCKIEAGSHFSIDTGSLF